MAENGGNTKLVEKLDGEKERKRAKTKNEKRRCLWKKKFRRLSKSARKTAIPANLLTKTVFCRTKKNVRICPKFATKSWEKWTRKSWEIDKKNAEWMKRQKTGGRNERKYVKLTKTKEKWKNTKRGQKRRFRANNAGFGPQKQQKWRTRGVLGSTKMAEKRPKRGKNG